jgi:hypothetical protein
MFNGISILSRSYELEVVCVGKGMDVVLKVREYETDLNSTQNGKFGCFFQKTDFSFTECNLRKYLVCLCSRG